MGQKSSSLLARRYASALLDLAEDKKAVTDVEKDMGYLAEMFENFSDFRSVFDSPGFGESERMNAIQAVAQKAKFHKLTNNFLGMLVQNHRTQAVHDIVVAFFQEAARRNDTIEADVEVAQELNAKQAKALHESLKKSFGKDVNIQIKINPEIIGGLIVTVGSFMVDHSVRRKLERLKAAMAGHSNQNSTMTKKEA